jgi:hypothetical protein
VQPKLLEALINQHFAKQLSSTVTPRWDGPGPHPALNFA